MFDSDQSRADEQHNEPTEQENMGRPCPAMTWNASLEEDKLPEVDQAGTPTDTFGIRLPDSPKPHTARNAPRQHARGHERQAVEPQFRCVRDVAKDFARQHRDGL